MVNPRVSMWLNIVMAVLGVLVGGGAALTTLVGAGLAQKLVAAMGLTLGCVGAANSVLHAYSSPMPGPMVTPQAQMSVGRAALVLFAVVMAFGLVTPAMARAPETDAQSILSGDPIADILQRLESVKADVVAGVIGDIQAADADAAAIDPATNQMKDPISHACYPAQVKFLQSLPQAVPLTGPYVAIQLFQRKRDFVAQLHTGLPVYLRLGCVPLLGDEAKVFVQTLLLIGVKVAPAALTAIFPVISPVTLPALSVLP